MTDDGRPFRETGAGALFRGVGAAVARPVSGGCGRRPLRGRAADEG